MFTGLVQKIGILEKMEASSSGVRIKVSEFEPWDSALVEGESIAVNGACMTALLPENSSFEFDLSPESLEKTNFKIKSVGSKVNLERSLRLGDRMGGHWVTGHIDGLGEIQFIEKLESFFRVQVSYPPSFDRYFIPKGSVCVDGVSLTINQVDSLQNRLELMIIPHTWQQTIFSSYQMKDLVNLEIDVLAKHIEKLQQAE